MSDLLISERIVFQRIKSTVRLLGKYCSTSVLATSADFASFHVALTYLGILPVPATVIGRLVGAAVAFRLQRKWVFGTPGRRHVNTLRLLFVSGILIGMALNVSGVWLLNGFAGLEPWPARIVSATAVWLFGFLFNKKMVFG